MYRYQNERNSFQNLKQKNFDRSQHSALNSEQPIHSNSSFYSVFQHVQVFAQDLCPSAPSDLFDLACDYKDDDGRTHIAELASRMPPTATRSRLLVLIPLIPSFSASSGLSTNASLAHLPVRSRGTGVHRQPGPG